MKKVLKKRTGFTLVELLIVIIIIGILAGAMLLVAGSGTDKAEATKIVSDLRSLKAAALMYYADNPSSTSVSIASLDKYMDKKLEAGGQYRAGVASGDTAWFVGRKVTPNSGVAEKLQDVKTDARLYGSSATPDDGKSVTVDFADEPDYAKDKEFVLMRAK